MKKILFLLLGCIIGVCSILSYLQNAYAITNEPFVILASGQSNMARTHGFAGLTDYTIAGNLYIWNNSTNPFNSNIGTDFLQASQLQNSKILSLSFDFANNYALNNPETPVYLINTARGGTPIQAWIKDSISIEETTTEDDTSKQVKIYQYAVQNTAKALNNISETKIDLFLWMQGEDNTRTLGNVSCTENNNCYKNLYLQMESRFEKKGWFEKRTPHILFELRNIVTNTNFKDYKDTDPLKGVFPGYLGLNNQLLQIVKTDTNKILIESDNIEFMEGETIKRKDLVHLTRQGTIDYAMKAYLKYLQKKSVFVF